MRTEAVVLENSSVQIYSIATQTQYMYCTFGSLARSLAHARRSEAQQWRTTRQQAKLPPSSFALRRTDQIGTERAAAVKKAALAKARISRAAAEDDVHRAIATMWHR